MLKILRIYYNYLLFRLGKRKVLPSKFVNRIPVKECGEELVPFQDFQVRKTISKMLTKAETLLPDGYGIKLLDGYRSADEQTRRRQALLEEIAIKFPEKTPDEREQLANQRIAKKSGHHTGGAVDVTLLYNHQEVDCGTRYLEFSPLTPTDAQNLTNIQLKNRKILFQTMTNAGFVNYPLEWWHYCYGDKMYAAYKCQASAQYGYIENNTMNP